MLKTKVARSSNRSTSILDLFSALSFQLMLLQGAMVVTGGCSCRQFL